jgi:hypothetical protein
MERGPFCIRGEGQPWLKSASFCGRSGTCCAAERVAFSPLSVEFQTPVVRQNSDLLSNQTDELCIDSGLSPCRTDLMLRLLRLLSILPTQFYRSRPDLLLENMALRQQLAVLRQRRPQPRFSASDRLFWLMLRRLWRECKQALILVQPETVVR